MLPFDESAAHLPPPRADEPANLRREIIEELTDHLTCARRREQLVSGAQSEEAIQHRVLDRFGDPVAIARKLWLDWMWEKIMTQRILIGVCILLAVVTCAALAFAWVSINRQHDLIADVQHTSQAQLQEQQKQFERLLAASQNSKAASDWNPVELRFVKGNEDGPPLAGMNVNMSIRATETGIPPMEGVSDEQGLVRFERVRYGSYTVTVRNTASESLEMWITLQPGQGLARTIVCPDPPTEPAKVTPHIAWPEDLADRPLWFRFEHSSVYRPVASKKWYPPSPTKSVSYGGHQPLIAPNGDIAEAHWRLFESQTARLGLRQAQANPLWDRHTLASHLLTSGRGQDPQIVTIPAIEWPGKDYRIPRLEVLVSDSGLTSFEELTVKQIVERPSASRFGGRDPRTPRLYFDVITLPSADWSYRIEPGMADKPGMLWLTPTAEAIEKVRAALAEIDENRQTAEVREATNRMRAAEKQVEAFEEQFKAGKTTFDFVEQSKHLLSETRAALKRAQEKTAADAEKARAQSDQSTRPPSGAESKAQPDSK